MNDKTKTHRPVRYGVEKTEDGGVITFIMEDGETHRFELSPLDIAGITRSIMHLFSEKLH